MKIALTIAGSDPTGGAGVQADIKVFRRFGVHGLSVLSALTAQNTFRVKATRAVDGEFLEEQLNTVLSDIRPHALKTGMLYSRDAVRVVANMIRGFELDNVVVDPVLRSSTGASLIQEGVLEALRGELLPLALIVTPNIHEASMLSGVVISREEDIEQAARELVKAGARAVVITGGHLLPHAMQATSREAVDVMYDGAGFCRFRGRRIRGEFHGTGCAFSAALTALLARGTGLRESVRKAREFMESALSGAGSPGKGMKLLDV